MALGSRYQKVMDTESGKALAKTNLPPFQHGFFSYRTAFFLLFAMYLGTAVLSYSYSDTLDPIDASSTDPSLAGLPYVPFDQSILFDADMSYEAILNGMDDPWTKHLLPPGRGFIKVPTEVTQSDGSTKVEEKPFCISMFHQLHCIAGLKWVFESEDNRAINKTSEAYIMKKKHMAHCFDFLRQAVMCAGDMTLEPVDEGATDGWNVTHTCRDFKTIYDFATERSEFATSKELISQIPLENATPRNHCHQAEHGHGSLLS
ncbi:hypothetical protein IFR05_004336 [Cadophora sp. M221]|nr:hypothetical protein IFR05_004336 [Cadophora sp. M221]